MLVDVKPLRDEFVRRREANLISARHLAKMLDWQCSPQPGRRKPRPDSGRVLATLGLRRVPSGRYPPRYRERISEASALKIAELLQLDPVDIGL